MTLTLEKQTAILMVAIVSSAVLSLCFTLLAGPSFIAAMRHRFGERIDSSSPTLNRLHAGKSGTPTMGGLLIISGFLVGCLPVLSRIPPIEQATLFVAVSFMLVGAFDDYTKLSTKKKGLSAKQKFVLQCLLGGIAAWWIRDSETVIPIPFMDMTLNLGWWAIPLTTLVIVSTSNAVNLTDGLDGLATGCSFTVTAAIGVLAVLAYYGSENFLGGPYLISQNDCASVAIMSAALCASLIGFLFFNCHPAQVFMGDTGSLPIGAIIGVLACGILADLWLLIVGAVLVAETLSVIIQLSWYRIFGWRPLRCSPIHNHFVFQEVPETRIVTRFWIVSAIFAFFGVVGYLID